MRFSLEQFDPENGIGPRKTVRRYVSMMQLDIFPSQVQSDPRTVIRRVFERIKTIENPGKALFVYTFPVILDFDQHARTVVCHRHQDRTVFGRIFESIGKQVEQHLFDFIGIDPQLLMRRVRTEFIDDLFRFGISLEITEYLLRKLHDIHLFQRKHHFIIFDLPEIENLIHDIQQMARVTLNRPDITLNFGVLFPLDDAVERIEDQRQRSADFVGDVRKEL